MRRISGWLSRLFLSGRIPAMTARYSAGYPGIKKAVYPARYASGQYGGAEIIKFRLLLPIFFLFRIRLRNRIGNYFYKLNVLLLFKCTVAFLRNLFWIKLYRHR